MTAHPTLERDYAAAHAEVHAAHEAAHAIAVRRTLAAAGLREAREALRAAGYIRDCNWCGRPSLAYLCPGCAPVRTAKRVRPNREAARPVHVWERAGGAGEETELVDPRRPVLTTGGGFPVVVGDRDRKGRVYRGVRGAAPKRAKEAA